MDKKVRVDATPMTDEEMRDIRGGSDAGNKINNFLDSKLARAVGPTLGRIVENHGAEGLRGLGVGPLAVAVVPVLLKGAFWIGITGVGYYAYNKWIEGSAKSIIATLPTRMVQSAPIVGAGLVTGFATRYYAPSETVKKIGMYTSMGLVGIGVTRLFLNPANAEDAKVIGIDEKGRLVPVETTHREVAKKLAEPISIEIENVGVVQKDEKTFWTWLTGKTYGRPYVRINVKVTNKGVEQHNFTIKTAIFRAEGGILMGKPFFLMAGTKKIVVQPGTSVSIPIQIRLDLVEALAHLPGKTYIKVYAFSPLAPKTAIKETPEYDLEAAGRPILKPKETP